MLKKSPRWLQIINYLLDKQIHFIILAIAVIYLAYAWFNLQLKYAQLQATDFEGVISLSKEQSKIRFSRDNGANRPAITTDKGDILLEYTDWASTLIVNDAMVSLWDTYHGYSVDSRNGRFFHSMAHDGWTLFKEISFGSEPNRLLVEYYFRSDRRLTDLTLQLAHFRYHYLMPRLMEQSFTADIAGGRNLAPSEQAQNARYRLELNTNAPKCRGEGIASKIEEVGQNNVGTVNIRTTFNVRNIPVNKRTLIACEEISWKEISPK